jgi:hypothetical protein
MGGTAVTPDVSGLSQPGAQAPAGTSAPTPTQAAGGMVDPGTPHGRLLQMVQSLAVGVDSFARAAATHGREGGVGEVQDYFAKQQQEKIQQEQATTQQARAKQETEETDLRMSAMRAHMAIDQFNFEQLRARAPLETQKLINDVSEQKMAFMEHLSKATGIPVMVINSMANDDTQKTLGVLADTAKQNNTTTHDVAWAHVQNDGAPGNGSQIKGLDLKNFGNTVIPAESASQATLPVKTQLDMGEQILGADDPTVKGGKQAFQLLQQGLASGQMTANQYYAVANRITAPIVSALTVKNAVTEAQEKQATLLKAKNDAIRAGREADPQVAAQDAALKARTTKTAELNVQKTFDAQDENVAAKALAGGDPTALSSIASMRGDQRLRIFAKAKAINPAFNTETAKLKAETMESFATGPQADQIQSFNTFLGHAAEASELTNHYRTTALPIINTPLNKIRGDFGDATYTQFATALQPVRDEFETFLQGGHALTETDKKASQAILSDASSPAQIQAALKQMSNTAFIRLDSLNQRYKSIMGTDYPNLLTPDGVQAAKVLGKADLAAKFRSGGDATNPNATPTHIGIGPDGKKHYSDASGRDLGLAE